MKHRSKSYQIDTPALIWRAFSNLHDDYPRINDRLVELQARDVKEQTEPSDRDPELQSELDRVLGEAEKDRTVR